MKQNLKLYFASLVLALGISFGVALKPLPDAKADRIENIKKALPAKAIVAPKKKHKVLVFSKTNGFRHGSIATGVNAMALLGEQTGVFEVTHSEDETMFDKENLEKFDGVIMLNTTGEIFRPKKANEEDKKAEEVRKQNLVNFVKAGGGLMGMHSATDTYKKWKAYTDMMGGAFAGHPWHEDVSLKTLDADNPVTAMFGGEEFVVKDEIYQFRDDTANPADRKMLLALSGKVANLDKGKRKDKFYPVSWIDTYGDGRIFYCSLGHRDEIFWNPKVLEHYLAGIQFALGDLEADATGAGADDAGNASTGEWVSMFDGKTLDGWKSNDEKPNVFSVTENGEIKVSGGRAHLFYVGKDGNASFKNFEFKAKVKNEPGSNSGIYFHTQFQDKGWPEKGYESQVNISHKDAKKTGGLYAVKDVMDVAPAKDNEWYDYNIRVEGKHIIVRINGVKTAEYVEPDEPEHLAKMPGRKLSEGTFAFQGHDPKSTVYFKDLKVMALP